MDIVTQAKELLKRIESEFEAVADLQKLANGDGVNLTRLRQLVTLDALKSVQSAIEKKLAALRTPLESEMLTMFEQLGTNNFNIDGRTVYLHREWWAKTAEGKTVEEAVAALKGCEETAAFVKESFNTQTLSAYFRERRVAHDEALEQVAQKCAEAGIEFNPDDIPRKFHVEVPEIFPVPALASVLDFSEKTSVRSRAGGK